MISKITFRLKMLFHELYLEILSFSDINTIVNFCQTSTQMHQLCNQHFWQAISKREGCDMDGSLTVQEWIGLYLKNKADVKRI